MLCIFVYLFTFHYSNNWYYNDYITIVHKVRHVVMRLCIYSQTFDLKFMIYVASYIPYTYVLIFLGE